MPFSKQALVDAVSALVDLEDEKARRYGEAVEAMARFRTRHPDAWLGYELEVLNPLVDLASADPAGFSRIQQLVNSKRLLRGANRAWPEPEEEKFDKVEYQRQLMQERRRRSGRAVEIENMQRPERDRLIGNKRLDFENRVIARWGEELRSVMELARQAEGGRLSKARQQQIREKFWADVDQKLDDDLDSARRAKLS